MLQKDKTSKFVTSRNLNDKNLQKINDTLTRTNWSVVITENVDELFDSFYDILLRTLDQYAPIVTRKLSSKSYRREL